MASMPRPNVSEEVETALRELTEGEFHVPEERVSFEDRLWLLIESYEALEANTTNRRVR